MPKSGYYRRKNPQTMQALFGFANMNAAFRDVDNAWNLAAPVVRTTVVRHPRTAAQAWTHTLTYEFSVITANNGQKTLRGHVHYDATKNYRAFPGNFWVEGIPNHDARTPVQIVQRFADQAALHEEAMGLMAIAV